MLKSPRQGVALADFGRIVTFGDFSASRPCDDCGVVRAIICNDQQAIAGMQLRFDVVKRA